MDNPLGHKSGGYQVQIPVYEGPLDLLLGLIERAELDITAVSLAMVTDQYLDHLHRQEHAHPEEISAFLVIAAKLVLIKSEALLPRPPIREPGEEDVGQTLVDQLRLYKRFKEIGVWLLDRQERGLRTHLRVAPPPKVEARLDLSDLTLARLQAAAEWVFAREQEKQTLGTVIAAPRVTIREKIDLISKTLKQIQRASFRGLVGDQATRLEIVVTFLALLELIKRYRVEAIQTDLFGDIQIQRMEDWTDDEEIEIEFE
jgi:segregation and condensation protein A